MDPMRTMIFAASRSPMPYSPVRLVPDAATAGGDLSGDGRDPAVQAAGLGDELGRQLAQGAGEGGAGPARPGPR
jgi:hypothetical protein